MDESVIVGMLGEVVGNMFIALWALPVILLGMWLSTRSWAFYPIAVVGFAWLALVVSRAVYGLWINPDIEMSVKVVAWTIPFIFLTVLNIGSIFTIQAMRRQKSESNR